jgi:tol-pal system protein YbgF
MKTLPILALITLTACAATPSRTTVVETVPSPAALQPGETRGASDRQLAELQNALAEMTERLDVMSDRIQRLESAPAPAPVTAAPAPRVVAAAPAPASASPAVPPPPVVSAPALSPEPAIVGAQGSAVAGAMIADRYRGALTLYARGRVAESRKAFQSVFDADPNGELADNALYWLGETWFSANDYPNALKYYQRIATDYPDQNKAPDAMYKMGVVYVKTGDLQLAKQTFEECIRKYPYSTPASSARAELKRIKY